MRTKAKLIYHLSEELIFQIVFKGNKFRMKFCSLNYIIIEIIILFINSSEFIEFIEIVLNTQLMSQ